MVPTSKSSKVSEKHSWRLSLSRKSIGRVHSPFSLHTRVANVLEEDYQNAFDPNARAVKVWEHLLLLSLLVEAFLVPYFLAFQPEAVETVSTLFTVFIACEGVFAVDLYVQAHTGYYSDGNLIRDKKLTVRSYVRSFQFALDIIAILPYQVFVVIYPKLVAKLLLLKLLRWSRIPHFVSSLDEFFAKYFVALKLLKVLASTVYLAHVQACIRFNFHHFEIIESSDPSHSLHSQYLASMFWSVGIMTGLFEGELPHHSIEFLFTILVALCGFSMFTTLCATIFVISKCESGQTEAMEARINQLVHVLSFHRVPKSQQTQAIEYLKRYYTDTESHDRETSKLLCPSIANDIQVELLKATIADISIFEGCNDQFIVAMTSLLEMVAFPAQTVLFSTGDDGDAVYVVHSGVLAIVINSVMVREIRKGSCFGELSVFSSMPRTATVISTTYVILYKLSRFHCERVLQGYPEFNWTHLEDCNGSIFEENSDFHELQAITFLEYSRSLYYAVGVLASPGKSVEPTTDVQLIAALILMLSGFLITAIVVDNVQKRFTASAFEQKEFFATSTRIQLFLRRQNAPLAIHHRVKSFLDYWWSSHRGAVIGELLADLPRTIRLNLLKSICLPVLQTLSLLPNVRSVQDKLEDIMVENAKFILYGQGEIVYRHGDSVVGMFFLLEGEVYMVEKGETSREIPRGSFFGTAVLTQQERGEGYTEHVSANSGCILLLVSRDQLQAMEALFPTLKEEFLALEQRLQGNKLATMRAKKSTVTVSGMSSRMLHNLVSVVKESLIDVHDPDSQFVLAWETWVFVVMTVQWALVMLQSCYLMGGRHKVADALLIFLELSFVLDIQIRSRLGYYEFGNKIMDPVRIKRKYLRSGTLVLDIIALIPLFIVNLALPLDKRWGLLNVNKLLRLFKVPKQFHALETKYLKHTTELRLFKLLYYTFMLSHFLGCLWFNFASRVAVPSFVSDDLRRPAFGENHWLPSEHLEHGSHILQYMASLYWSFGLMSASSEPEFPKSTAQCLFSALTMTTGFFLIAYVIGNFTDIIELNSSETREFNAEMRSVQKMLDHFQMPEDLQQRVKTFLLFKRYHSITQEGLLVRCLPPSLLTDIRLVHLKPMIEKVEFLRGMEGSITRMLVSQFTQVLISRGELICNFDETGSDMFFVFAGVLDILVPSRIANRHCSTFKSVIRKLVTKPSGGSGALGKLLKPGTGSGTLNKPGPGMLLRTGGSGTLNRVNPLKKENSNCERQDQLVKVNEISAGRYFGENGLFTNGKRNACVQAQTSCILYRLSRVSMELVFARYPKWKQKVLRIANIRREQERLLQLSAEEQRRGMATITGMMLSRADIMNERAERLKEDLDHARLKRSNSERFNLISTTLTTLVKRFVHNPLVDVVDGIIHGVPVQTRFHLIWLRFMVFCAMYVAVMIPYQLSMDAMNRVTLVATTANAVGLLCEVAFILDIWFSWHVQESPTSLELYEQNLRSVYKKQRMLFDVIAAIPFYGVLFVFNCRPWMKLQRCVKIVNVMGYLDEINRRSVANELTRFWHVWVMYLLVIHWVACSYLAVATEVGFSTEWESWLPSQELEISDPKNPSSSQLSKRFLRGLFFATTAFVKKARNIKPETAVLYTFQITMSFIGLITMSFVIGELASLFISYIGLEVDFRKNHIAVELYLARLRVSDRLKTRTYAFMTSLWSSHAGVNYDELLEEMPRPIRAACVLHASKEPLDWFVMKVFTPTCWDGKSAIEAFTLSLAEQLRFEGYPRDENVVTEGSIVRAMYFVTKGHLNMQSNSLLDHPVGLGAGSYFGERGLLGFSISAYTVTTVRACDLFSLRSESFIQVLKQHSFSRLALDVCSHSYKHIKEKHVVACSEHEMEEHWGVALLLTVQEICKHQPVINTSGEESAEREEGEAVNTDSTLASEAVARKRESTAEQEETSADDAELPAHLEAMTKTLKTPENCFHAFAPLLHIMLATDPLNWNATFSKRSTTKDSNLEDRS
ncbi:hypothetical protein JG688_00013031 [Phytophthora aleatoria]|uniref:Cyclic nucleotide-binding domain-containing protein n=1 Tax=Phytophthora aleatoria TaxID=2496075 RepID=A0A8J5IJR8_9STRA|nr:hypothetical protein JG688_00013031 [Phytophthora aleatoria]